MGRKRSFTSGRNSDLVVIATRGPVEGRPGVVVVRYPLDDFIMRVPVRGWRVCAFGRQVLRSFRARTTVTAVPASTTPMSHRTMAGDHVLRFGF
jgi:hypothetical protein